MYCPKCRAEYRPGFSRCSDCGVELVNDLPVEQEPEYVDLVTVFEGNSNSAVVTSARLSSLGIESWIKDEGIQGVFPNLGPAEVQVCVQDKESALEALGAAVQNAESLERGNGVNGPLRGGHEG